MNRLNELEEKNVKMWNLGNITNNINRLEESFNADNLRVEVVQGVRVLL